MVEIVVMSCGTGKGFAARGFVKMKTGDFGMDVKTGDFKCL